MVKYILVVTTYSYLQLSLKHCCKVTVKLQLYVLYVNKYAIYQTACSVHIATYMIIYHMPKGNISVQVANPL